MGRRRGNNEGSIIQLADGRWQGRMSLPNGKRKAVYGKTHGDCLKKVEALKRQRDEGTLTDKDMTVKQYLTKWLEHRALEVKSKTLSEDRSQCVNYIIPKIGKVKLSKLDVLKVQDMMKDLAVEVSRSCANRSRKILRNALGQAVRWQLLAKNPVEATKKLKEEKTKMVIWTYEEAARFLAVAKGTQWYPLFLLTMSTGLRLSEVLGLRWQDVKRGSLHICHTATDVDGKLVFAETTKTDHSNRHVSIPEDVVMALKAHKQAQKERYDLIGFTPTHGLVFDSTVGTPLCPNNLRRTSKDLQEKAKVPEAKFHDFRHWHASVLIEEGWDIRLIAKRLGHADPSITLRFYAHLIHKQDKEEAISLETVLPKVGEESAAYLN